MTDFVEVKTKAAAQKAVKEGKPIRIVSGRCAGGPGRMTAPEARAVLFALDRRDRIAADLRHAEADLRTARTRFMAARRLFGAYTDAQLRRAAEAEVGDVA